MRRVPGADINDMHQLWRHGPPHPYWAKAFDREQSAEGLDKRNMVKPSAPNARKRFDWKKS